MTGRPLPASARLLFALLLPLLAGCVNVGIGGSEPTPDIRFHVLGDPEPVATTRELWPTSIAVRRLRVGGRYEARVVERAGDDTLRFREYERWADEPDEALTAAVIESLVARGNFRAVLSADAGLRSHLELTGDVLAFDLLRSEDGPLRAAFAARFQLADRGGELLATAHVRGEEPLPGRTAEGLGAAMGKAVDRAVGTLLEQWGKTGVLRGE